MQALAITFHAVLTLGPTLDGEARNVLFALAMGLAIFCSSLALGIAVGIRRRIDQIAGPPDDEDD